MTPALQAEGLAKRYGAAVALDGVSFEVRPGEIVGLLGPNGAGKTTALQLCLGLLHPDAGTAQLFGLPPGSLEARRRVGYAPDGMLFPRALSPRQVLRLHAELLGLPGARCGEVLEQLGMSSFADRPCAVLSRGQGQRLGLAQALLGAPDLLLLDEPTAGLDPAGVHAVRELLVELRARGAAILVNSHLLSELERVCDRALFLKGGRIVGSCDVRGGAKRVEVRVANAPALSGELPRLLPGARLEGDRVFAPLGPATGVPAVVRTLVSAGAEVLEVRLSGAELEQLYLSFVEGRA